MDAADVESAEEIKVGKTGRIDSFYICGQCRLISLLAAFFYLFSALTGIISSKGRLGR